MKPYRGKKVWPVRLFVSYSHENAAWCKRLFPVLRVKANVNALQSWHDTELKAGDRWDKEIRPSAALRLHALGLPKRIFPLRLLAEPRRQEVRAIARLRAEGPLC